jgi:hypothetical protein
MGGRTRSPEGEAMNDWPDPDKPGVPLNPERDGWHWIVGWSDKLFVAEWDSDQKDYVWFDGGDDPSGMVENGWTYAGPVLMPAEVDAFRAENARLREVATEAEREACASVTVRIEVPDGADTWSPLEAFEEGLLLSDAAFRDAIRSRAMLAAAPGVKP